MAEQSSNSTLPTVPCTILSATATWYRTPPELACNTARQWDCAVWDRICQSGPAIDGTEIS